METRYLIIDENTVSARAKEYFDSRCCVRSSKRASERLQMAGADFLASIKDRVDIRCAYIDTDDFKIDKDILKIGKIEVKCAFFEKIQKNDLKHIFMYVVTSGEYDVDDDRLSATYYADTWGTAYVEAARDEIKGIVENKYSTSFVCESFGPGFYGMPLEEIKKFFSVIDCEPIGVTYREGGLMVPLKTVAGIYLVTDTEIEIDFDSCKSCIGNKGGCEFCSKYVKNMKHHQT